MLKIKKILSIIAIVLCIFQLVVLATAINVGQEAINRGAAWSARTFINNGIANESGTITSIEIWAFSEITNLEVATFYSTGTNAFATRDSEAIPGAIAAGEKITKTVDLTIVAGDYIGCYFTGDIEYDTSGFLGTWYYAADLIPSEGTTYSVGGGDAISLKGIGATEEKAGTTVMFTFSSF